MSFLRDGKFSNYGSGGADGFRSRWIKRVFVARNGDLYFIDARKNLGRFAAGHIASWWSTNGVWPCAVAEDQTGIVAAFGGDLFRLEPDRLVPWNLANGQSLSVGWIHNLLAASDGSLWVASEQGVQQIQAGSLRSWPETLKAFYLCEDDSGAVWAALDNGIARFKNGVMRRITTAQGLSDNVICAMVMDRLGYFWMDSSHGIIRVSGRNLNAVADGTGAQLECTLYDGLDSMKAIDKLEQDYSACKSTDGRLWFPSSKGLIVVDPAHLAINSHPPPVFLDAVRVNGRSYAADNPPVLEPGPGNLEFEYSALDYTAPHKIKYRYRLTGYDQDWVNAGPRRSAFYTNIKPGRYTFQVQAGNGDGAWNLTGASIGVQLPSEFRQTLGFRLVCGAALIGLMFYLWWVRNLRQRELQLLRTNLEMDARVRERTAELAKANATLLAEIEQRKLAQKKTDELQEQLIVASRLAGQAEVASSILHNVGNVLNSVNVSTTLLGDRLRRFRINSLAKAADLLEQLLAAQHLQNPQLLQLPVYLRQLGDHFGRESGGMMTELSGLGENIEHIKSIVAFQQNFAKTSGMLEHVNLSELADSVLRMYATAYRRHEITVERDYQPVPPALVDKHKVLQILINLVDNAKHACNVVPGLKKVSVRIHPREQGGCLIAVEDNGVGIAPDDLTRIFSHGFTTRKDGHGFGLHGSALAAKQMGGTLSVASGGPGRGATFTLNLPPEPPPASASSPEKPRP
jgi:signal transduction histidine kinase